MSNQLVTPVVLMIFNRPETTRLVLRAIAAARPQKLLIVADGPRLSHPEDEGLCAEARAVVSQIDWPCEVLNNFADSNLGCQERVVSGLTWAFSHVEEAIILEDDCLPTATFFPFCQELLARYRADSRVGMISGNNLVAPQRTIDYSYYFSRISLIWGWATWRSAWHRYDRYLQHWQAVKRDNVLREIYFREDEAAHWARLFESVYTHSGPDTWDYQWAYTLATNNMLSIVPGVNMVRNIGFGREATHTLDPTSHLGKLIASPLDFPLRHPPYMIPLRSFDELEHKIAYQPTLRLRLQTKLSSLGRQFKRQHYFHTPKETGS